MSLPVEREGVTLGATNHLLHLKISISTTLTRESGKKETPFYPDEGPLSSSSYVLVERKVGGEEEE